MSTTAIRRARGRRVRGAPQSAAPAEPTVLPIDVARGLSVEVALYGLILVATIVSRFWDLGRRALHHDESLHAQYSWMLAVGRGYTHDPLMHGPFLFHANALAYLLFGANDATSRIVPALTGCVLVLIPWLLRPVIGRWGALFASAALALSPGFLYYARFIRHDIYTATATLLLFAAIVRYIADRRPRWIYLGAVALAWAITNHEITYAVVFINVTFLAAVIVWSLSRRLAVIAGAICAVMGVTAVILPKALRWPPLPPIPWQTPTQEAIVTFLGRLLTHPMIVATLIEGIALLAVAAVMLSQIVRQNARETVGDRLAGRWSTWLDQLFARTQPGSASYALYTLLADQRTLWGGLLLFFALFAVLFTTLFAHPQGLISGMFGAIGYWLGQHDVRRGEQPWFYYLVLMPQYELLAVTAGGAMSVLTVVRVIRRWLDRQVVDYRLWVYAFLVYWAVLMFMILSWAGEKMPWLITHATLPFTVLAGALLGEVVERLIMGGARLDRGGMAAVVRWRGLATGGYLAVLMVVAAIFVFEAAKASVATPPEPLPVLPTLAAIGLATIGLGQLVGHRRAGLVAILGLAMLLSLAEVRFGWIASFTNGDIPKEQLIYVQTAPDVPRVVAEIERLSVELTGGKDMQIIYDGSESGVVWPFEWYLRDFKNRRFMPEGPTADPGPEVPVIVLGLGNRSRAEQYLGEYEAVEYVLRWHYPEEETYRPIAIAPELRPGRSAWRSEEEPHGFGDVLRSLWGSIAAQGNPAEQARLWRYLMYRHPYAPVGSFNYVLLVRKDVLRYYNGLRY